MNAPMTLVIDASRVHDWGSFHDECQRVFGFPDFYGRNMDAWIDCMTDLDKNDGMRSFTLRPGEVLALRIDGYLDLKLRQPRIAEAIVECSAFVNFRRIEAGEPPVIALVFGE